MILINNFKGYKTKTQVVFFALMLFSFLSITNSFAQDKISDLEERPGLQMKLNEKERKEIYAILDRIEKKLEKIDKVNSEIDVIIGSINHYRKILKLIFSDPNCAILKQAKVVAEYDLEKIEQDENKHADIMEITERVLQSIIEEQKECKK
jgi:hypothetical protein